MSVHFCEHIGADGVPCGLRIDHPGMCQEHGGPKAGKPSKPPPPAMEETEPVHHAPKKKGH